MPRRPLVEDLCFTPTGKEASPISILGTELSPHLVPEPRTQPISDIGENLDSIQISVLPPPPQDPLPSENPNPWAITRYIDPSHPNANDNNGGDSPDRPWCSLWPLRMLLSLDSETHAPSLRVRLRAGTELTPSSEVLAYQLFSKTIRGDPQRLEQAWNDFRIYDTNLGGFHFLRLPPSSRHPFRIDTYHVKGDEPNSKAWFRATLASGPDQQQTTAHWSEEPTLLYQPGLPYSSNAAGITLIERSHVQIFNIGISGFDEAVRCHGPCPDLAIQGCDLLNLHCAGVQAS